MLDNIGGVTPQLVGLALDAALLRHELIANNIANVDTPGFQAKRLSFEEQLRGFVTSSQPGATNSFLPERIDWIRNVMHNSDTLVITKDETVELDREMVHLTENTLRYQALIQAAGKSGEIIKMAVREGRR